MPRKKKSGAGAWVDPDDAPELTEEFFDRAEIRHGDKIIQEENRKQYEAAIAQKKDREKKEE